MMKKFKLYTIAVTVVLAAMSCSDDFLEQTPQGVQSVETFYTNAENAKKAIIACYAPMQLPYYVSAFMLPDIMSEDNVKGSTYGDNSLHWNEMAEFQGLTSARILSWKWDIVFEIIFKTNVAIQKIPDINMDETRKNQMLGEAYFLRGYMYFENAISWGNVPIILEPLEDYFVENNTTTEVWAQVETDLKQAASYLPEKSEWPENQIGRATKGAAQALLGKALLYQHKYAEAETALKQVVESSEYSLDPDFGHVFTLEGENGSGSIFELQFAELGPDAITDAEGNFITKFQGPRDITGWGFNQGTFTLLDEFGYYAIDATALAKISNYNYDGDFEGIAAKVSALSGKQYDTHTALYADLATVLSENEMADYQMVIARSAFKPTDPRFEHTLLFLDETIDGVYIDPNIATDDYTGIYNRKVFMADIPAIWRTAPNNERIIRLADVYLMYAEAAAQNNHLDEAKHYLKLVRDRASTAEFPLADFPNYTNGKGQAYEDNKEDLIEAILNERRLELAFEHFRFFDLVRTGKAAEVLAEFGYIEGVHNIWPIPQGDIDRAGGKLKQNKGY